MPGIITADAMERTGARREPDAEGSLWIAKAVAAIEFATARVAEIRAEAEQLADNQGSDM